MAGFITDVIRTVFIFFKKSGNDRGGRIWGYQFYPIAVLFKETDIHLTDVIAGDFTCHLKSQGFKAPDGRNDFFD